MDRVVSFHVELQPEGTYLGARADMPGLIADGPTLSGTPQRAETIVRNLIATAGSTFDPLTVLA